jgi:hypothetical protein
MRSAPKTAARITDGDAPRRPFDRDKKQRTKIYEWEGAWLEWNLNSITLAQCRSIVRSACRLFGVRAPTVVQHKRASYSFYDPNKHQISMQAVGKRGRGGKNRACVLHEAAHAIIHFKKPTVLDHGAYFASVYVLLLAKAKIAPLSALTASAAEFGIKFKCKNS